MGFSSLASAGISGLSSLLGASQVSDGAAKAAAAQQAAAQQAEGVYSNALNTSTSDLTPYTSLGSQASGMLGSQLADLSHTADTPYTRYVNPLTYATDASPYATSGTANNISASPYDTTTNLSQAQLEQTPGYQFTLNQGEKAVQNSAAARGLGVSGAALKGASTYATGLADNTYQQQYQDELTSNAQNFSNALNASNTNYSQQAGANEQNFSNALNANKQNASNALTAAGQNFGMDQTGFSDTQSANQQSYNMLSGTTGIGANETNALVGANTSAASGTGNALIGAGSAQAAADNATGQAYGSAFSGVGNALNGAIGNYNGYGIASAINSNVGNANTFGSSFNALLNGGQYGSNFLGNVSNALNKTGGSSGSGGTNV